jgi:hypothetical protein
MAKELFFEHTHLGDQYPSFVLINKEADGDITLTVRSPQQPKNAHLNNPEPGEHCVAGNSGCMILPKRLINHLIVALAPQVKK